MGTSNFDEPMIEAFVYDTSQNIESVEQLMIKSESESCFNKGSINEIFRSMHTIKGSAAMMMYNDMASLAHNLEDIFYVIRENEDIKYDFNTLVDIILDSVDYLKIELMKITNKELPDGDSSELLEKVRNYLENTKEENNIKDSKKTKKKKENKQKYYISGSSDVNENEKYYKSVIHFKDDSEMENVRAYTVVHSLLEKAEEVYYKPKKHY